MGLFISICADVYVYCNSDILMWKNCPLKKLSFNKNVIKIIKWELCYKTILISPLSDHEYRCLIFYICVLFNQLCLRKEESYF